MPPPAAPVAPGPPAPGPAAGPGASASRAEPAGAPPDGPQLAWPRFAQIAAERPGTVALEHAGLTLSYGEVAAQAVRLARHLRSRGVTRGSAVAVCAPLSPDLIVAMLAIWKAGGVHVPLDPSHPAARLAEIAADIRPRLVLTAPGLGEKQLFPGWPCLPLGAPLPSPAPAEGAEEGLAGGLAPEDEALDPSQAAYLFYTSGTTGPPKGVVASHANLIFYVRTARERYGFSDRDTFCSIARPTFSISLFELLSPLLCGGRLLLLDRAAVLDPERLARALRRVTVLHAGPSLLSGLGRYLGTLPPPQRAFPGIRHASSGGDLIPPALLEEMKVTFPRAEIFVIYGCTEISCLGSTFAVPREKKVTKTLVGRPFPAVQMRLLEGGREVAVGEVGEVHVASPGLTPGYWERPALNAEKFVWMDGARHYATGDLARRDAAGDLELLGRADDQVKLHGIRVELGEIEATLRQAPGVREVAVAARTPAGREKTLVAYVVRDQAAGEPDDAVTRELHAFLRTRLPGHLIPAEFVLLERLPLTPNLKVDRRALPDPASWHCRQEPTTPAAGPDLEAQIERLFARLLGQPRVGLDADFFAAGGDSLLALRATDELGQSLGRSLPPWALLQCPTARQLARQLGAASAIAPRPVPLNAREGGPPLFLLAAVHAYRPLARELEADLPVHALSIDPDLRDEAGRLAPPTLAALATSYAAVLEKAQPEGAFLLAGYSFGGVLAYEVAQQLRARGREVRHLWLLDSMLPAHHHSWVRVADRFLELTARQAAQTAAREAQLAIRNYHTRRARRGQVPDFAGDPVRERDEQRTEAYLEATREYVRQIRPYEGAATLVVAGRRLATSFLLDPECGWSPHIGDLRVTRVDAGHHDLLSGAQLPRVAGVFRSTVAPGR